MRICKVAISIVQYTRAGSQNAWVKEHRGRLVFVASCRQGWKILSGGNHPDHVTLFSHMSHHLDPQPPAVHVAHPILFTGPAHRIPFPRRLRVPPCRRRSCHPIQRPLLVSRSPGRWWRDGATHDDRHHDCGFRRCCTGHTLQVPCPLLRARLRLFRDRKLGWLAILSQFLTWLFNLPFALPPPPFRAAVKCGA